MSARRATFVTVLVSLALFALFLAWRRPAVLVLGDSITEWGAGPVAGDMRWSYRVDSLGHSGLRIDELLATARAQAPTAPDRVILNVGTNDALQGLPIALSENALREMVGLFASTRCMSIVTVNENVFVPAVDVAAIARAINDLIRRVASERGADVVEWSELVRRHNAAGAPGGDLTLDLVHPTALGYGRLAGLYQDSLAKCS